MLRRVRLRRPARAGHPRAPTQTSVAKHSLRILLIALGLLIAQGPVLLHLLLVPHATCEHGELVEVGVSSTDGPPDASVDRRENNDRPQIAASRGDGSGHDHCDALAVRHKLPEVGAPIAAASLMWITPIEACGERAETRPVPLLSLAPKSSPPQA